MRIRFVFGIMFERNSLIIWFIDYQSNYHQLMDSDVKDFVLSIVKSEWRTEHSSSLVSLFTLTFSQTGGWASTPHCSFIWRLTSDQLWVFLSNCFHSGSVRLKTFTVRASALSSAGIYLRSGGRGPGWCQPPGAQWWLHRRQLLPGNRRPSDWSSPSTVIHLHLWTESTWTILHRQPPAGK